MKWLYSLLAFIFVMLFVSGLTMHVFFNTLEGNLDSAKLSIKEKSSSFADQAVNSSYSEMNAEQKTNLDAIKSMTVEQKRLILMDQCKDEKMKTQVFCDSKFLEGTSSFDSVMKENIQIQVESSMIQALDTVNAKFINYTKYPLFLLSIISAVLGLIFYILAHGLERGSQIFSGNVSWLSFLSALSYKLMPSLMDKLVSSMTKTGTVQSQQVAALMKDIVFSWMTPAMNATFTLAVWMTIISGLIWIGIKFYRKYTFSVN